MGILDELLGGGRLQKDFADFVARYEQGHPAEDFANEQQGGYSSAQFGRGSRAH